MNLDAMKELLAAVEAGEVVQSADARAIWPELDIWGAVCCASQGSTDAALALHGALLPDWCLDIGTNTNAGGFFAMTDNMHLTEHPGYDDYTMASGDAATPAQALLIATLRGKIAEMKGEPK